MTGKITGSQGLILDSATSGAAITITLNNSSANNDYAGDTVIGQNATAARNRTLVLGAADQIPNGTGTGNVGVNTNGTGVGTLNLAGFSETINGLSGNGTVDGTSGTPTLTLGDNNATGLTFMGVIQNTAGTLALTKTGTGNQTLSGVNTYIGTTTISGGTLTIDEGSIATSSNIVNNAALVYNLSTNARAYANVISGSGSLTKSGTNTLTLTGVNTYTGTTTISSGTLAIDDGSIATSSNIVNNAALVYNLNTNARTYANVISGIGSLSVIGTNILTLTGLNTYSGNTTVGTLGTLALADNAQLKFVLGNASNSNNSISGAGTVTLEGDFAIDTAAVDATALTTGTWTLENVTSLSGAYGSNFTVVGFTDAGSDKWEKTVGAKKYSFDETTGILTLAPAGTPFSLWASSKGLNGTPGFENGKADDPDGDGKNNLYEFAFDGDPLSAANDGKIVGKVATLLSLDTVLTLTLPVRTGAIFPVVPGDAISGLIDGIVYSIEGDVNLSAFADNITEVTGTDATNIQIGLPMPLSSGWTYRTFRAPGTVPVDPKAFLRAKVSD